MLMRGRIEAKISQQIFGVAVESSYINVGILGAAPSLNGWENDYPSIFDNLAEQGLIGSRAFGMDLRGFHTDSGKPSTSPMFRQGVRCRNTNGHHRRRHLRRP